MDTLAAIGSLVISEGATAPLVITTGDTSLQEQRPHPDWTPADRQSSDAVFTTHQQETDYAVPATLLMVSASIATLKSIAIDEMKSANERKEEEKEEKPATDETRKKHREEN